MSTIWLDGNVTSTAKPAKPAVAQYYQRSLSNSAPFKVVGIKLLKQKLNVWLRK
ncbi:MAG: hypothetical protein HRT77_17920 [Halioglobus sp.]|nr:hypothetical protein [Halioglobus sp.]